MKQGVDIEFLKSARMEDRDSGKVLRILSMGVLDAGRVKYDLAQAINLKAA